VSSKRRLIRALEIAAAERESEVSYSAPLGLDLNYEVFGIRVDREELGQRIEARLASRLSEGLVEEVHRLLSNGLDPRRLEGLGLEYREVTAHLLGDKSFEIMVDDLGREIRRFAKRQETYFRGMEKRGIPITWIDASDIDTVLRVLNCEIPTG
jgi:tRNA dimethylallyltransferase